MVEQGPADAHPLLLPPGELIGQVGAPVRQTHLLHDLVQTDPVHGPAVQEVGQDDVLVYIQHRQEVEKLVDQTDLTPAENGQLVLLEGVQVGAVQKDPAAGGFVHAPQDVQQGGLPAARGTHDGDELPLFHREGHIVQGLHGVLRGAVGFGQMFTA